MKITYSKGCFYQFISFKDEINDLSFSPMPNNDKKEFEDHWINNQIFIKNMAKQILDNLFDKEIEYFYKNEISHDYENSPSISETLQKIALKEYIDNYNFKAESYSISSFFEILQDMIQSFPPNNDVNYNDCETCGDTNYQYEVII